MTEVLHMTGDLFTTTARGIGHGVNTHGVMGHGIAVQFRERFPQMHSAYRQLCKSNDLVPGETMIWEHQPGLYVYNIASQDAPGRNARLEWLEVGLDAALQHADEQQLGRLALPRIGAGIGGLNWADVESVLKNYASIYNTDIEVWTLPS